MDNQEIRARARELYGKYFVAVFLIGLCSEGIQNILSGMLEARFGEQVPILMSILVQLLLIPLAVGAIGCIEPLWTSEQVQFKRLFAFYTCGSQLGQSLLLSIIPMTGAVIVLVPMTVLVVLSEFLFLFIALLIAIVWLSLRLQMAMMLFASGRCSKALDAYIVSYQQMRGRLFDLIAMCFVIGLPQAIITKLLQALAEQNNEAWIFTALEILFALLYTPYSVLSIQGWVLERLKDGEQPQESENKRSQGPFLPEIKKEVEPSSEKLGDQ